MEYFNLINVQHAKVTHAYNNTKDKEPMSLFGLTNYAGFVCLCDITFVKALSRNGHKMCPKHVGG
jgi:hypothetical protein